MIKVVVTSTDVGDEDVLLGEANMLGTPEARNEVIEMDDLISSLIQTVSSSIRDESKLKIEITGTVRITGGPATGEKVVCFNVHNEAINERHSSMRLIIETTVKPEPATSSNQ